jgi:hypothetical protein
VIEERIKITIGSVGFRPLDPEQMNYRQKGLHFLISNNFVESCTADLVVF